MKIDNNQKQLVAQLLILKIKYLSDWTFIFILLYHSSIKIRDFLNYYYLTGTFNL
jgi:hypothetical protein